MYLVVRDLISDWENWNFMIIMESFDEVIALFNTTCFQIGFEFYVASASNRDRERGATEACEHLENLM